MSENLKNKVVRLRLSTPILARTRCKYCKGLPTLYYMIRNPVLTTNVRSENKKFKLDTDISFSSSPKTYTSSFYFSQLLNFNKYRPRLHRVKGNHFKYEFVEVITCDCMQTSWYFSDKWVESRRDISQRKSRLYFPFKFIF